MKALIRNKGETVIEDMHIKGINWETGYPLTQKDWPEGAYTLVQNYVEPTEDFDPVDVPEQEPVGTEEESDEYITVGGVKYKKC